MKTLGFAQFEVTFGNKEANFFKVEQLVSGATSTNSQLDLLVLPELCFTGYDFIDKSEVAKYSEPLGTGPTSAFLSNLSSELNTVIIAGYPEEGAEDKYYNSCMLVTPTGDFFNYRKIHLFSRENDLFSPGDIPPQAIDTSAGRIGMMICFDWFFPETARLLALDGAQVIAHPSNLVLPYCQRAMYARSVENGVLSITANRTGTEDRAGRVLTFTGGSQILGVDGMPLAQADAENECIMMAVTDLSQADQKQLNPYNNLFGSRRTDLYEKLLLTRSTQP